MRGKIISFFSVHLLILIWSYSVAQLLELSLKKLTLNPDSKIIADSLSWQTLTLE